MARDVMRLLEHTTADPSRLRGLGEENVIGKMKEEDGEYMYVHVILPSPPYIHIHVCSAEHTSCKLGDSNMPA